MARIRRSASRRAVRPGRLGVVQTPRLRNRHRDFAQTLSQSARALDRLPRPDQPGERAFPASARPRPARLQRHQLRTHLPPCDRARVEASRQVAIPRFDLSLVCADGGDVAKGRRARGLCHRVPRIGLRARPDRRRFACANGAAARRFLEFARKISPSVQSREGVSIKHDVSVPVSAVPAFLRDATPAVESFVPGACVIAFGHLGDGNIHFNVMQPPGADRQHYLDLWRPMNDIVHAIVARYGGSYSAEHGIGQLSAICSRRPRIRRRFR